MRIPYKWNFRRPKLSVSYSIVYILGIASCSVSSTSVEESDSLVFSYLRNSGDVYRSSSRYSVYADGKLFDVRTGLKSDRAKIRQTELENDVVESLVSRSKELGLGSDSSLNVGSPKKGFGKVSFMLSLDGMQYWHSFQQAQAEDSSLTKKERSTREDFQEQLTDQLGDSLAKSGKPFAAKETAVLIRSKDDNSDRRVYSWNLRPLAEGVPAEGIPSGEWSCLILPSEKTEGLIAKEERAQRIAERRGPGGLVEVNPLYRSGGKLYDVRFHPLLPDESDCSSVQPYFVPPAGVDSGQ